MPRSGKTPRPSPEQARRKGIKVPMLPFQLWRSGAIALVALVPQVVVGAAYFAQTYQWRFNGVDIAGATTEEVSFVASASTAGFYSVIAYGPGGTATSTDANVTVLTVPPHDATLATGDRLALTIAVAN